MGKSALEVGRNLEVKCPEGKERWVSIRGKCHLQVKQDDTWELIIEFFSLEVTGDLDGISLFLKHLWQEHCFLFGKFSTVSWDEIWRGQNTSTLLELLMFCFLF